MKLRIIAADDNHKMLAQIVLLLGTEFDVVATATDGIAALQCIEQYKPDVAVLDVVMPRVVSGSIVDAPTFVWAASACRCTWSRPYPATAT